MTTSDDAVKSGDPAGHEFVTLDVFAERPFEGNQLAVFPDAAGLPEESLPAIAREFRFSETAFVLPPERGGTARVRIFTLAGEADFAGHPLVGAAAVLAERRRVPAVRLEVPAGNCDVVVRSTPAGLRHATVETPQPFSTEGEVRAQLVAGALSLPETGVRTDTHAPTACGMGRAFVVAEVEAAGLAAAVPDAAAFARARAELGGERFAVLAYAWAGEDRVDCRMFSPLTGTVEDAATGSANVALAGLLLHARPGSSELRLTSRQGVALGRPSRLDLHAWRADDGIRASVGGTVVPMTAGRLALS